MKALSVKQPWANWIAQGRKTIETRKWHTNYRGPILIVSSKMPDMDMYVFANGPYGYAVATAVIKDCRRMTFADKKRARCDWYEGAFAWVLAGIKPIKPFPVKGSLRLFEVDVTEDQLRDTRQR